MDGVQYYEDCCNSSVGEHLQGFDYTTENGENDWSYFISSLTLSCSSEALSKRIL